MNIRKITLGLSAALLMSAAAVPALAQSVKKGGARPAFDVNDNTLALGVGFGAPVNHGSTNAPVSFVVIFDHGTFGNVGPGTIGLGGIFGITNAYYRHGNGDKQNWTDIVLAARGTYHLWILKDKNNKFDPYGGASVGVRIESSNGAPGYANYSDAHPYLAVFVGAKYNVSRNFGFWSELGNDVAFFKLGVNFNF